MGTAWFTPSTTLTGITVVGRKLQLFNGLRVSHHFPTHVDSNLGDSFTGNNHTTRECEI